jgi:serine/threonine protein kinase
MEYVEGGTLAQLLRKAGESKEPLAIPSLVDWMGQLVDGIEAINEKMLHRDLRPENILMSGDRLKVGDFGLSKLVGAATRTRTFKGSQHVLYMAPEGWRSETNDIQIDMYSMGITFFEMATLEYPYDVPPGTGSFEALERMHLFEVPKDVRALREDLPVGIVQVVMRLMAKRAADRFSNWEDVRAPLLRGAEQPEPAGQAVPDATTVRLLEASTHLHRKQEAERLEAERAASQRQREESLDDYQREQLVTELKSAVELFNAQSSLGSIHMSSRGDEVVFDLPGGRWVKVRFFPVDPPPEMRRGIVRYAACVTDPDGVGFNYLLVRSGPDDLYGTWQTCHVTNNPLFVQPAHRRPQPFGFADPSEFAEQMEHAEGGLHVYQYSFGPGGPEPLRDLMRGYMERRMSDRG